jgi:glycosyltransferase involved in cell wall biosynthesis
LGETSTIIPDLLPVYRAADLLITPHNIATRIVRESLACGLQTVASQGNPYTPYRADPEDLPAFAAEMARAWRELKADRPGHRLVNRQMAEREFDPVKAAGSFMSLLEGMLRVAEAA